MSVSQKLAVGVFALSIAGAAAACTSPAQSDVAESSATPTPDRAAYGYDTDIDLDAAKPLPGFELAYVEKDRQPYSLTLFKALDHASGKPVEGQMMRIDWERIASRDYTYPPLASGTVYVPTDTTWVLPHGCAGYRCPLGFNDNYGYMMATVTVDKVPGVDVELRCLSLHDHGTEHTSQNTTIISGNAPYGAVSCTSRPEW